MKTFKLLILSLIACLGITSCEEDEFEFIAAPEGTFSLTNTFLAEYVLPAENTTNGNIGAVFAFNEADFGVQTPISYELQASAAGDFSDALTVGSVGANGPKQIEISIGALKNLVAEYGWEAPAEGQVSFRVRAFPGESGSTTQNFSDTVTLNITLLEPVRGGGDGDIMPSNWGVVGSAYNNWGGAGPDGQFYTTSQDGVIVAYVTLIDGEIKFRTDNDWSSGDDLGDANDDGILDRDPDNNIAVTAGDYKITFNTNTNEYSIVPFSWGVVGSGYNDWGGAGPDAKFYYDYTTDSFKVSVNLIDGEIKFRTNNDWSSGDDLGDAGNDGFLDRDADNNIPVTAGSYLITINLNDNSYSIVERDVWGVVGSAFNNWGETPDFSLTEVQENVLVGDVVTLMTGELKFRTNNDWSSGDDLGDANDDGVLDRDPDNNIAVEAGVYRVRVNLDDNSYALYKIQ